MSSTSYRQSSEDTIAEFEFYQWAGATSSRRIGVDVGAGSRRFSILAGEDVVPSLPSFINGLCSRSGATGLPEAAIHALHKVVLHRLSRRYVVLQLDGMVLLPMQDRP